ncbi:MAG: O-antigen ligase family protein [Methylobacter sp.]|nr:O-antigen ligase family protein [Methylobacter sp.]
MIEFLIAPVLFLAAFLAAIGATFCLMGLMRVFRSKEGFLPYIFYTSTFINTLMIINQGRNLFVLTEPEDISLEPSSYVIWIARINTALVLFSACQRIAKRLTHYGSTPKTPTLLIIAFLFFFFTNVFTAAFFSAHPSFEHEYVYLVLVGTASLLFVQGEEETAISMARNAYFIFLVISAGFIFWKPELVIDNDYLEGLIPGLTYRYAGLTSHPNSLGLITTLFLLCLWNKPFSSRWINVLAWTIGYSSLVLAQSKTCWISFMVCMSCLGYFKYGALLKQRFFDFKSPILPAICILMAMITGIIMSGVAMLGDIGDKVNSFFSTRVGADLMTMTGRTMIWEIALNEWHNSPLFGYGLTIWDAAHRAKIGMGFAVSAHSQFYQTLASAGIVGVTGLLIYVTTLFWFTLKTARSSQGLTIAIFLMLFFRSISEVSIDVTGYFNLEGLAHVLLLMIVAAQFKSDSIRKPKDSPMKHHVFVSFRGIN